MAKFGKWVGLGLGWALGGPIGGILGLAVGSIFDTGTSASTAPGQIRSGRSASVLQESVRYPDIKSRII